MKKFLNTPYGSWLKIFLAAVLAQWLYLLESTDGMFTWDYAMLKRLAASGLMAVLPVIINWINPKDPRYGITEAGKVPPGPGGDRPVKPVNP